MLVLSALAACAPVREEPYVTPYDAISTPAGTILLLNTYRTRSCSWFECGESSYKYLGASVEALLLRQGEGGAFTVERLARIECDKDEIADCEHGNLHPQLRRGADGPVLVNTVRMVAADTLAFSTIEGPAIAAGSFLCRADSLAGLLPAPPGVTVVKVIPDAALAEVASVYYTRRTPPAYVAEAGRCAAIDSLPRPEAAQADVNLYLVDAVTDGEGRLAITYKLISDRDFTARPLAMRAVLAAGEWVAEPLDETARGAQASPLFQPSYFDTSTQQILLDIWSNPGGQLEFLLVDRAGSITRPPPLAMP